MTTSLDRFQFALVVPEHHRAALAAALRPLEQDSPRLRTVAVYAGLEVPLVVLLDFEGPSPASLDTLVLQVDATVHRLSNAASRDAIAELVYMRPVEACTPGAVDLALSAVDELLLSSPVIELQYEAHDEFFAAWARAVAEFGLRIDGPRTSSPVARVAFTIAGQRLNPCIARVLPSRPTSTPAYFLDVAPSPTLRSMLDRRSRERRASRLSPPPSAPSVARVTPRYDTMLEVTIPELADLANQWATELSHGGLFVYCAKPPELRTKVGVKLNLPQGHEVTLAAEVVHRILAGARPGVGVQFTDMRVDLLEPIHRLLGEYQRRRPKVLVIDDEAIWRSTLSRVMTSLGCDVQLAADGHEGLIKVIDGYFDLDLVILDLHMPHLDGQALLERVRRQGGDQALKIYLFSAAAPDELRRLAQPGLATGVFSKLDSIDALSTRIAKELRLPITTQRWAA